MFVILAPDAPQSLVDEVSARASKHGWQPQLSRGDEQSIVALGGHGDPIGVEQALSGLAGVELVQLRTGREYWRQRVHRKVVGWLALGLGILCAMGGFMPIAEFVAPPARVSAGAEASRSAIVRELPDGSARLVHLKGKPVLVVHHGADRYFAVSATCTHMGDCQLEWDAERAQVICPCHGCVFDLFGNVAHGPASVPLERFLVERTSERIVVRPETP